MSMKCFQVTAYKPTQFRRSPNVVHDDVERRCRQETCQIFSDLQRQRLWRGLDERDEHPHRQGEPLVS